MLKTCDFAVASIVRVVAYQHLSTCFQVYSYNFKLRCICSQEDKPSMSIPWCKFLTCVPLWAILIAQCGQSWLFYTQLTELPTYMNNILHFDIVSVSVFIYCLTIFLDLFTIISVMQRCVDIII